MNNLSQPPQPTEPDMGLLYLGSLFETLDYTLPPERDEAEKHLCRYLWTVDFERLPPSDQAARVVIECAMLLSSRPCVLCLAQQEDHQDYSPPGLRRHWRAAGGFGMLD